MRTFDNPPEVKPGDRHTEYVWTLQELADGVREVGVLSVLHDGDRKQYRASVSREMWQTTEHSTRRSFEIGAGSLLASWVCPRFNKKTFEAAGAMALDALRDSYDTRVLACFDPSDRSCGCDGMHHVTGCEVYAAQAQAKNERAALARGGVS